MLRKISAVLLCVAALVVCASMSRAQTTSNALLARWRPGEPFASGTDTALIAGCFTVSEIPDSVFRRMEGRSFKAGCRVPRSQLRYLTVPHFDGHGHVLMGEMVADADVAGELSDIFRALFRRGYPIERMVLIDEYGADDRRSMEANNSSAFNYRVVAGTARLSHHARGRAVDINPLYNPYVKRRADGSLYVSPEAGRPFADRSRDFIYRIGPGDALYEEFVGRGWTWGGDWRSIKDYQHFEKPLPGR